MRLRAASAISIAVASLCAATALAETTFDLRGYFESDGRSSFPSKDLGPGEDDSTDEWQFIRLDNTMRLKARANSGDTQAVADVALIYRGFSEPNDLASLQTRERSDPFDIESDALYIDISNFGVERLDLRLGRQIVQWGSADRFNPTSVINPLDLEDPIKFGDRVPNEMIVLSYTAPWSVEGEDLTIFDELTLTVVGVPVHRPGQYPGSAALVVSNPDLFVQFVDSPLLKNFVGLQNDFITSGGRFGYTTQVERPEPAVENAQFGGRLSMTVVGVDLGVMYYNGYSDALRPLKVEGKLPIAVDVTDVTMLDTLRDVIRNTDFSALPPVGITATMGFPEVQVTGFEAATSLDFLGGLGLWVEGALTFHDDQDLVLQFGDTPIVEELVKGGRFWKYAVGSDYTITSWWYLNVQYLHGFVDEFGTDNLNDYLVAGSDFKLFSEQLTLRMFSIYQFQDHSAVLYPALMGRFWTNTEIDLGAFWMVGEPDSKFGSVAAGPSQVFLQGRYSF